MSPRRPGQLLASRAAWALLAAMAVAFLAYGSIHGNPSSERGRISSLDGIIKCPACQDLSIGQSDAPSSVALRHDVAHFVHRGWSNARIESWVTARYGSNVLLVPSSSGANTALYLVPIAIIGLGVGGLGWYLWRRRPGLANGPPAAGENPA